MGTQTPRVGLILWSGTDNAIREAFNANWQAIESKVALLEEARQPFWLRSITYESGTSRMVLTLGPGRVDFLGTMVSKDVDSTLYITAPSVSTTYYIYITSGGTFIYNTTGASVAGAVLIWTVTTGAALTAPITPVDRRGQFGSAAARKVADDLKSHNDDMDNPHETTAVQVGAIPAAEKGAVNGVPTLDSSGKVVEDANTWGGRKVFRQNTAPASGMTLGDVWINPTTNYICEYKRNAAGALDWVNDSLLG